MGSPRLDNKGQPRFVPLGLALLVILGCITYWAVDVYREAHDAAVRSYLMSVCSAVEEYRLQHGRYPIKELLNKALR